MMQQIEHKAIVVNNTKNKIFLQITEKESCGSCPIFSFCRISQKKDIALSKKNCESFTVGDKVNLCISQKAENMGILFFYGLPSIIIFVSLAIACATGAKDVVCAVAAVVALMIYFSLLIGLKHKISVDIEIRRRDL